MGGQAHQHHHHHHHQTQQGQRSSILVKQQGSEGAQGTQQGGVSFGEAETVRNPSEPAAGGLVDQKAGPGWTQDSAKKLRMYQDQNERLQTHLQWVEQKVELLERELELANFKLEEAAGNGGDGERSSKSRKSKKHH